MKKRVSMCLKTPECLSPIYKLLFFPADFGLPDASLKEVRHALTYK